MKTPSLARRQQRILLLNPPGRRPVLRDYYCSTFPKAGYYWQPVDLLCLASLLRGRAEVLALDAVSGRLDAKQVMNRVRAFNPDAIFALASPLTLREDASLLRRMARPGRRIALGGETALDPDFDWAAHPWAIARFPDFTAPEAADFLLGAKARGRVDAPGRPAAPPSKGVFFLGMPPHELFDNTSCRLPLWRGGFHSLLTEFGCPHGCLYCNSNSLGFKVRDVDEIARELQRLKRLGARKIYLRDMTFGADKRHGAAVLDLLERHRFQVRGYLRADQITPRMAAKLKKSGFDMVQIGVECVDEASRKRLGKNVSDAQVFQAFALLREHGVGAGAHFMTGLDRSALDAPARCAAMARRLGARYCSINIYKPRAGARALPQSGPVRRPLLSAGARIMMGFYNLPPLVRFIIQWGGASSR